MTSLAVLSHVRLGHAATSRPPGRNAVRATSSKPSLSALGLLSEIIARLPGTRRPVIHVMATCARASSIQVARELAAASAFRFGRTLLVAANQDNEPVPIVRGLSWLMSTLGSEETNNVMPDSSLAGLHHIQLDPDGTAPLPITTWLDLPQNFQMIVVAGAPSAIDPRSAGEAARCNGSLLAVAAGISRLDDVRAAGRLLTYAGANVLGTVLYDAPRLELGFPRLRRAG